MVTFKLIARPDASARTKQRIAQYGPEFEILERRIMLWGKFKGRDCLLVRRKQYFFGWIPLDEITIEA